MIAKKNSRFDLERKRIVLFQVGLMTVGSLTLAAFTYRTPQQLELEKRIVASNHIEYMAIEQEKVEPEESEAVVKDMPDQSQSNEQSQDNAAVTDDIKVTKNSEKVPDAGIDGELGIPEGPDLGDIDDVKLAGVIDEWPAIPTNYIGGAAAMQKFIFDKVEYPLESIRFGDEGTVYISFVIEKDGSVSNVDIVRGVTKKIDREAKRVVRSFPNWKPAENAHGKVRTRVRLPIVFALD